MGKAKTTEQLVKEAHDTMREVISDVASQAESIARDAVRGSTKRHIFGILGVKESSWHPYGWELRDDANTPTAKLIREVAEKRAKDLLAEIETAPLKLTSREMREMRKAYRETYLGYLQDALQTHARDRALARAEQVADMLTDGFEPAGNPKKGLNEQP